MHPTRIPNACASLQAEVMVWVQMHSPPISIDSKQSFFCFVTQVERGVGGSPLPSPGWGRVGARRRRGFPLFFAPCTKNSLDLKFTPKSFSPRALRKHKTSELKTQRTSKRGGGSCPCPQRRWPHSVSGNSVALVATPSRPEPVSLCGNPRGSGPPLSVWGSTPPPALPVTPCPLLPPSLPSRLPLHSPAGHPDDGRAAPARPDAVRRRGVAGAAAARRRRRGGRPRPAGF